MSVPLSSLVEFCIKQTKTRDELDVYRKMIAAQSKALDDAEDADAIACVIVNVIKLLPGFEDVIKSLRRYKQDKTHGDPLCVDVDEIPVYLSWNYHNDLCISLQWCHSNNASLAIGHDKCVSIGDAVFTFPKRAVDFARALHKQNIDLDKEVRCAVKK